MTQINTLTTGTFRLRSWDRPNRGTGRRTRFQDATPYGELQFSGVQIIPAKITTDTSRWQLSCVLPRGFAYAITQIGYSVETTTAASLNLSTGFDVASSWSTFGTIPNLTNTLDTFLMRNAYTNITNATAGSTQTNALFFVTAFKPAPEQFPNTLIPCTSGNGSIVGSWMDKNNQNTVAVTVAYRIRLLQYSIEQYREAPISTPSGVIAAH